jgi:hypothetical protein
MAELKPDIKTELQSTAKPFEPEGKDYTVKPGCAIEHAGARYEGNSENPVKVKLSEADAEVHKSNLE